MKWIAIFLLFMLGLPAWAQQHRLLKCLGAEEKRYHQNKDTGPFYDLNQKIIAELVQIPHGQIRDEDFNYICRASQPPESWKFLKLSIQRGKELFVLPQHLSGMQKQITLGMVEDYNEATRDILINLINQIQALSPTPHCLMEEIPKLGEFFRDIKYLQEDVDMKTIFRGRDEKIFMELDKYPKAFQRCSERLRKKPKSESTTEAK